MRVPVVMWPSIGIEFEVAAGKGCNASGGLVYIDIFFSSIATLGAMELPARTPNCNYSMVSFL